MICRTSHYGPHGTEVLQCIFHASGALSDLHGSAPLPYPAAAPQLHMLKVRGDPNVPAGRLSILMNLSTWSCGTVDPIVRPLHHALVPRYRALLPAVTTAA